MRVGNRKVGTEVTGWNKRQIRRRCYRVRTGIHRRRRRVRVRRDRRTPTGRKRKRRRACGVKGARARILTVQTLTELWTRIKLSLRLDLGTAKARRVRRPENARIGKRSGRDERRRNWKRRRTRKIRGTITSISPNTSRRRIDAAIRARTLGNTNTNKNPPPRYPLRKRKRIRLGETGTPLVQIRPALGIPRRLLRHLSPPADVQRHPVAAKNGKTLRTQSFRTRKTTPTSRDKHQQEKSLPRAHPPLASGQVHAKIREESSSGRRRG